MYFFSNIYRLLEFYILHGPQENAVDHLILDLFDVNRKCPQKFDKVIAAHLLDVLKHKGEGHVEAARKYKLSCSRCTINVPHLKLP